MVHVGIIGAGLSGLLSARTLADNGHDIQVFEKARGPGGRMSTRYEGELRFDHGAQYFTVRDERFRTYVDAWLQEGLVQTWKSRPVVLSKGVVSSEPGPTERFVGVPGMNAVAGHLARSVSPHYETRVTSIDGDPGRWSLHDEGGRPHGPFDALIVSAPPAQSAALLERVAPGLSKQALSVALDPCWAVMAAFSEALDVTFDAAFVKESPLSWIARNTSKPGRPPQECWILHGSPAWSTEFLEVDPKEAGQALLTAFFDALDRPRKEPVLLRAHRWRYSIAQEPLDAGCLFDEEKRIVVCGDWCFGSRIEGAFLSGMAATGRILGIAEAR
jgi:predicted NAD/FAD-dependent oxidoreductase